jgi:rubrerythrin
VEKTRNSVAKAVLGMLMFDSRKHALMFQAMSDLAVGEVMEDADKEKIANALRGHLKAEKDMMEELKQLKKKIKDSVLRASLEGILKDEEKHHQLLDKLVESFSAKSDHGHLERLVGFLPVSPSPSGRVNPQPSLMLGDDPFTPRERNVSKPV